MNAEAISELSDDEFAEELAVAIFDRARFAVFLDIRVRNRTFDHLLELQSTTEAAIEKGGDSEMLIRRRNYKRTLDTKIGAMRRAHARARSEEESKTREGRMWRAFAHQLAAHLDAVAPHLLDEVMTPAGNLTAGEWFDRRNEKRQVAA